jgi:hypothetical protein
MPEDFCNTNHNAPWGDVSYSMNTYLNFLYKVPIVKIQKMAMKK